nr:odorant binding protein 20 [Aromia bungii]
MKFVTIFIFGLIAASNAELTIDELKKLASFREACMKETGVQLDLVKAAARGSISDDPILRKHMVCVFKKAGFMDSAGKLQTENIRQKLIDVMRDADLANQLVNTCGKQVATPEQTAFKSYKCFYEETNLPVI